MKELAEDFEITIIDWLKSDDENVTNLAYILAKKATTLQLLQTDVSKCVYCDNKPYKKGAAYCERHMASDDYS